VLSLGLKDGDLGDLSERLAHKTTLVLGPSGTGKSTLINQLIPDANVATGEISHALNSGRHTTTSTTWHWVDAARTTGLIDSPGFQEFGMHHIDAMQLAAYMPDFKPHVAHCKFYNCSHLHEPGCGVQAAVTAGEITASRYKLYGLLFAELTQPAHY
jgi:ribosome biogenesis GTPase